MKINPEKLKQVVQKFKEAHKCNRVFLSGEETFDQKYHSFRLSFLSQCGGVEEHGVLPIEDDIVWEEGSAPSRVEIQKDDVIAVFDNTRIGWFGNVLKSDCEFGALITTKGIVTLNPHGEGCPSTSGIVSWRTLLIGNQSGIEYCSGADIYLYTNSDDSDAYPRGRAKALHFDQSKLEENDLYAFIRQIKSILPVEG